MGVMRLRRCHRLGNVMLTVNCSRLIRIVTCLSSQLWRWLSYRRRDVVLVLLILWLLSLPLGTIVMIRVKHALLGQRSLRQMLLWVLSDCPYVTQAEPVEAVVLVAKAGCELVGSCSFCKSVRYY